MLVTVTQTIPEPPIQVAGDDLELRVWYDANFTSYDGVTPIESGNGQTGFYYSIPCTKAVDNTVIIPAFTIEPTTLSNPTANFFGQLWVNGAPNQMIFGEASGWQMPTLFGATINYGELALYNRAKRLLYPNDRYLTEDDVIRLINLMVGMQNYAGLNILGRTELSVAPVAATKPVAVGNNDPRVQPASSTNVGVSRLSVDPAVAITPIAVGDNDLRLPVAPSTVFLDRYAGADFGLKLTAAIASLPVGGGVIDCTMFKGAQSLSTSVTINKAATTILFGDMVLSMGTNQIIVPVGINSVRLVGAMPWGGGRFLDVPPPTSATTQFSYSGTNYTIVVGSTSAQTFNTAIVDIAVICTNVGGSGILMTATVFANLNRLYVTTTQHATATGTGIALIGAGSSAALYGGFNQVIDPLISGFLRGIAISQTAGTFGSNVNHIIRGGINTDPKAGSIGIDINEGEGNCIYDTDIEAVDTGIRVGGDSSWNSGTNINFDDVAVRLIDIESPSKENFFTYRRIGTLGSSVIRDLGSDNTILGPNLTFGYDGTFAYIKAKTAVPFAIKSADGARKIDIGDMDCTVQAGDNGGAGRLRLNLESGTGGIFFDDGATTNMARIVPIGVGIGEVIPNTDATGTIGSITKRWGAVRAALGVLNALNVQGLQVFANNAAAVGGGLAVGSFYRTGADPDVVCIVH